LMQPSSQDLSQDLYCHRSLQLPASGYCKADKQETPNAGMVGDFGPQNVELHCKNFKPCMPAPGHQRCFEYALVTSPLASIATKTRHRSKWSFGPRLCGKGSV
jgi:hypothetical protein